MKPAAGRPALDLETLAYRVRGYIRVRWIFLSILTIAGLSAEYYSEGFSVTVLLNAGAASLVLGANAALAFSAKRFAGSYGALRAIAAMLILADILGASILVYTNGGVEARTVIVYALPLMAAGAFFGRRAVYSLAGLSAVIYSSIIFADYFRLIPRQVINAPAIHDSLGSSLVASMFYSSTFFMVAFVADYVLSLLYEREVQLSRTTKALNEANIRLSRETADLQAAVEEANKLNRLMVERELKMIEMKKIISQQQKKDKTK